VLRIRELSVHYGGLCALDKVSIDVEAGQFVAIVGPNGAGKTTLFKAISGTVEPSGGTIEYKGRDLLAVPPHERPTLGIAHVPEHRQVFPSMTVLENLQMGAYAPAAGAQWKRSLELIYELFPILAERGTQLAGTLSGGQQQMVAIGRGLASVPELLMLDEPSMGLAPAVVDMIFDRIQQIHQERGLTILLVEQRAAEALESCDLGYVLETGRVAMVGNNQQLLNDKRLQQSYLGL
jgi:branched-chain amino acid transport system ATP-binding protein